MSASSYNPAASSSGKLGNFPASHPPSKSTSKRHLALAAALARRVGMVPTWANVQTIRLAIESEAAFSGAPPKEITEMFFAAAEQLFLGDPYRPLSEWEKRELARLNVVNRFWFEDARWREKSVYAEFREKLRAAC